jgi:hypothetical protein
MTVRHYSLPGDTHQLALPVIRLRACRGHTEPSSNPRCRVEAAARRLRGHWRRREGVHSGRRGFSRTVRVTPDGISAVR